MPISSRLAGWMLCFDAVIGGCHSQDDVPLGCLAGNPTPHHSVFALIERAVVCRP